MIITKSNVQQEQTKAYFVGDKIVAYHTQNVGPILRQNYEMKKSEGNGWTKGKNFRLIGQLTHLGYESVRTHHPEVDSLDVQMQQKAWHKAFSCEQCSVWFCVAKGV